MPEQSYRATLYGPRWLACSLWALISTADMIGCGSIDYGMAMVCPKPPAPAPVSPAATISFMTYPIATLSGLPSQIAEPVADLNRDGFLDLVDPGNLQVFLSNGDVTFGPPTAPIPDPPRLLSVGD